MSVITREQLRQRMNEIIGKNNTDDTLSFIEDFEDTFSDMEERASGSTNWKQKYEENDAEWRKKYRERFFGKKEEDDDDDNDDDGEHEERKTRFEELFETRR